MKIPKRVMALIHRRARLACNLTAVDCELTEWLEKNGVLDDIESYDCAGGCEVYTNPWDSAKRIIKAIERKGGCGHEQMAKENPPGSDVQPENRLPR